MSKRIITNNKISIPDASNATNEFRVYNYGPIGPNDMYAVIIANDNLFEGL